MSGQGEPHLECDIVMKGGITSGVVYPRAATHLSHRYRFRSVGGSSAGAIAAALVAAAERGRAHDGFKKLEEIPAQIGNDLASLFQPSRSTKPLYDLLMAWVEPGATKKSKAWAALRSTLLGQHGFAVSMLLAVYLVGLAVAIAIDALVSGHVNWVFAPVMSLLWLVTAVIVTLAVVGVTAVRRALDALNSNGFGICDGHTPGIPGKIPLCDWMTEKLNGLAALDEGGRPLTYGDLWGDDAVAAFNHSVREDKSLSQLSPREQDRLRGMRQIDLEVMTTNLTLGRPYRFPFESREFFFCEECFSKYFPSAVVAHMIGLSDQVPDVPLAATSDGTPARTIVMCCPRHGATRVRYLPRPPDMPVVVGARLSLSFPGLISAVPMCYVDFGRVPAYRDIIVVWFSDGGIANNFPMNLFDTLWPTRPTFGIDLEKLDAEHGNEQTRLPTRGFPRSYDISSMTGFGQRLLDTMQNWVDTTQLTMSTYRNRVAEVRLNGEQGGMHLRMPSQVINEVAALGAQAAALFDDFDLADHQKKRFLTAMTNLDDTAAQLLDSDHNGFDPILSSEGPELHQAAQDVLALAKDWEATGHPADSPRVPRPTPDLRQVPRP